MSINKKRVPKEKRDLVYWNWNEFDKACEKLAKKIISQGPNYFKNIYGLPRGGLVVAVKLSHLLKLPLITDKDDIEPMTLVVDDTVDSGESMFELQSPFHYWTATLWYNESAQWFRPDFWVLPQTDNLWIVFPWEKWETEESTK